jgi:hypothetical protein
MGTTHAYISDNVVEGASNAEEEGSRYVPN